VPKTDKRRQLQRAKRALRRQQRQNARERRTQPGELPPWAHTSMFTPDAAYYVLSGEPLPGAPELSPAALSRLRAFIHSPEPFGLSWAYGQSTPALVAWLQQHGISMDPDRLRREAQGGWTSAWAVGGHVARESSVPEDLDGTPGEWAVGAAVCALWGRWQPDLPCVELLCDRMQESLHIARRSPRMAVPVAIDVARMAQALCPNAASVDEVEAFVSPIESLSNWIGEVLSFGFPAAARYPELAGPWLGWVQWAVRLGHRNVWAADLADAMALVGRRADAVDYLRSAPLPDGLEEGDRYRRLAHLHILPGADGKRDYAAALAVVSEAEATGIDLGQWDLRSLRTLCEERLGD